MITKDDINEKDMIDAINEIEVIYRTNQAILEENRSRLKKISRKVLTWEGRLFYTISK